ncbi:ABC transporter permease [Serinibacter salmoneus]|uniref:NitT/TauT family transport system permease protein n=1 Tax=Serinibacter salmoneus TaxID=556530 RepID=A0A2A9CYM2_9MICO|nr:ABC transporter permease subunit [Serinibacter salmoneus]PFG18679.1 NitT/TauT family transport system permease protein [Serinibacter salmoneus]
MSAPHGQSRVPSRAHRAAAGALPILAAVLGILLIWTVVSMVLLDPARRFLLPPPWEVASVLGQPTIMAPMLAALGRTTAVAALGLLLAVLLGTGWAVLMAQSRVLERILYPYAVILQTIPILALTPLIGIWFGYGFPARVVVAVIIAIFPMISNAFFGLTSAPSAQAHDLFTLQRASRAQRLAKLQVPAAVPSFFTGLRTAAGLSVIGAIVGDFFFQQGDVGIGGLLRQYTQQLNMNALMVAVALTALFGVLVFSLFAALDRWVVGRWYGTASR